jgi:hypothetical protein
MDRNIIYITIIRNRLLCLNRRCNLELIPWVIKHNINVTKIIANMALMTYMRAQKEAQIRMTRLTLANSVMLRLIDLTPLSGPPRHEGTRLPAPGGGAGGRGREISPNPL